MIHLLRFSCFWPLYPLIGVVFVAATPGSLLSVEPLPKEIKAEPFADRSGPRGSTLFKTLEADQTGVSAANNYADPRMWAERYAEFAYGSLGTGVTVGDYDQDGRPDIFIVNKSDPCRLYHNLGGMRFEDVTARAGIDEPNTAWKQGAAWADVNNDGLLDLYLCRFAAPNLLYLNRGDGTFVERAKEAGLALNDSSVMASFCDYDRDGWLDVYITTNLLDQQQRPQGQRDHLYHNRGDGTFTEVTQAAGLYGEKQSHSATWWDFSNDGWPDLYVANDFNAPDQMYRNNRDGTFSDVLSKTAPHVPYFSMGADLGDVNNDGLIDLFVADMAPRSREQNQRGMLAMRALVARDLPSPDVAPQYMQNALLLNTGTSRLQEAAYLAGIAATDWTWSVRLEDLDEDGLLDLHVTNGTVRDFFDADLLARKSQVSPEEMDRLVKAAPLLRERNVAYRNRGDLRFDDIGREWGLDHEGISFGAAFADLDGDGDLDLVVMNYQGPPTVCRNDSHGHHHVVFCLKGVKSNRFGIGATIELQTKLGKQIRMLSSARGYLSTSEPMLHFGLGPDEKIDRLIIHWPSGIVQSVENLPADQRYTITEPNESIGENSPLLPAVGGPQFEQVAEKIGLAVISKEKPYDELSTQRLLPFRHQPFGPGLALGDLDGDGSDDVVVGAAAGDATQLFVNVGPGQYSPGGNPVITRLTAMADGAPLIFDADGDGLPDLFIGRGGVSAPAGASAYQPRLLLGSGTAIFREAPAGSLPELPISAGPAVAADLNRDGRVDLFLGGRLVPGAYPAAPRSALLLNHGGKFLDATAELAPGLADLGMVTSALWTDVDQDGWLDLIVTTEWGDVHCWRNLEGHRFEDVSGRLGFSASGSGWWNSIAAADFNGDGKIDYAVGNVGLNTSYRASSDQPMLLLYGSVDASDRPQIIETESVGGKLFPRRGRNQLIGAIPTLARKFPTFASYAAATLEDLLSPERVRALARLTVTELQSGVFLSQQAGTYRFVSLPPLAQIAPIFGLVAGDFDGDGKPDLYAVQNSFAPIPETGRFDGGLSQFLKGDGLGGFTAVAPRESGLIVPGDAKALAVGDFDADGWPDFMVTRNNSTALVFRNRGRVGQHALRVVVKAPIPNGVTIGARVSVLMADGRRQTAEVYAGGGYLSQSAPSLFFGYTDSIPPREINVVWPDGRKSTHPWQNESNPWLITEPEANASSN